MDDQLIAYALNVLPANERAAVEAHLAENPAEAETLARLRRALQPLAADREGYDPPKGLVLATLTRTAEAIVAAREPKAVPRRPVADEPVFASWGFRRFDLIIAASIALLAVGLGFGAIAKVRERNQVMACQNSLRELHTALEGYSDTHGGRFPEVGTAEVPVAGAFVAELTRAGQLAPGCALCPSATNEAGVGFAYTLGYVGPGGLKGVNRTADPDGTPVAADLPPLAGKIAHVHGQNILFVGGNVRFSTTSLAGVNGDEIYRNEAGFVRAGLHQFDAALGRPGDYP